MSAHRLYDTWLKTIRELLPDERALATRRHEPVWHDQARVTIKHLYHAHLLAYWAKTPRRSPSHRSTTLDNVSILWCDASCGSKGHCQGRR